MEFVDNTTCLEAGKKRRPGNAHESFSGNSMSAYRILGPGGAERWRPDALWAAVGPATQLQAGELVPLNYGAGSSAAAPRVVLVWVQAAIPSIVGLPAPAVTRHDLAPRGVPNRLRVDEYPIEVEYDRGNRFTHRQIGLVSLMEFLALLRLRINGRIDAHAFDGQRRPACWCCDIETGWHDESELLSRSEHHLTPP